MTYNVPASGRLSDKDRLECAEHIRAFAGKGVEIVIRNPHRKRTDEQNAWLHCKNGPARLMADEWGESIETAKLLMMGECWGWHEVQGHRLPVKPQTSGMSVEDFSYFVDWVIPWAMRDFGVRIALPGEAMAA